MTDRDNVSFVESTRINAGWAPLPDGTGTRAETIEELGDRYIWLSRRTDVNFDSPIDVSNEFESASISVRHFRDRDGRDIPQIEVHYDGLSIEDGADGGSRTLRLTPDEAQRYAREIVAATAAQIHRDPEAASMADAVIQRAFASVGLSDKADGIVPGY